MRRDHEIELAVAAGIAEERRKLLRWLGEYRGNLKMRVDALNRLANPDWQTQAEWARDRGITPQRASQILNETLEQITEIGIEVRKLDFDP